MKRCLIIINRSAGGSKKVNFESVEKCLGDMYEYTHFTIPDDGEPNPENYDAVAACGGDGTLSSVLTKIYNKPVDVWYFPSGTLNDKAKAYRYSHARTSCPSTGNEPADKRIVIGRYDGKGIFTYVLACGTFTPIGYDVSCEVKKKLGALAYVSQILKEYKVHRIRAKIDCDGRSFEGDFTLIMFVKSPRCFGFRFNRDYDAEQIGGHLLAIRAPKHNGLMGAVEIFFPFFKAFFIGLDHEEDGNLIFLRTQRVALQLDEKVNFCRDGEKQTLCGGCHNIDFVRSKCNFNLIEK